jgi:hypothetical protein
MAKMNIYIPDSLKARMRDYSVNWSHVCQKAIEDRIAQEERWKGTPETVRPATLKMPLEKVETWKLEGEIIQIFLHLPIYN